MQVTRVWSLGIHKTSKQNERQWSIPRKISCLREKRNHRNCVICSGRLFAVQSFSHVQLFVTQWLQHARLPCPPPSPRVCSNSCPLSQSCYPTISSSATSFSSCLQSFPASGSFPISQVFTSGGQRFGASASASVLPMIIQDWFPLGLTGLISLQSKGLSREFSSTTIRKYQFFSAQPSLWSNSLICTWLLEKPLLWLYELLLTKWCLCFWIHCLSWSWLSFQGASIF